MLPDSEGEYIMAIRVEVDRIIAGAVIGFSVDGLEVGATQGECTVRRNVEYYDVESEQSFGTLKKNLTTDKRFIELTLTEVNLENLHRAWNDSGGVLREYSDDIEDLSYIVGNRDVFAYGMANDGANIFVGGSRLSRLDDLG